MSSYDFDPINDDAKSSEIIASNQSARLLGHYRQIYVWTFGLHSRTAKLGVAVVSIGIIVVLLQVTLSLIRPPHQRSVTELLAAAMSYKHEGELSETNNGEEKHAGKIPYKMGPSADGSFKFEPVRHWDEGFVEKSGRDRVWQIWDSMRRALRRAVPVRFWRRGQS